MSEAARRHHPGPAVVAPEQALLQGARRQIPSALSRGCGGRLPWARVKGPVVVLLFTFLWLEGEERTCVQQPGGQILTDSSPLDFIVKLPRWTSALCN